MFSPRIAFAALIAAVVPAFETSLFAQRVPNPNRAAVETEAPTMTGTVIAYETDKAISLQATIRREKKTSDFAIVKGETKVELPPRNAEIKLGMQLAVWAKKDDANVAARIGAPGGAMAANPQPNVRRPNNRNNPRPAPSPMPQPAEKLANIPQPRAVRPPVTGLSPSDVARQIDQHIDARLKADKLPASPICDDAEFIRRVYLDITGKTPPAEKCSPSSRVKTPPSALS